MDFKFRWNMFVTSFLPLWISIIIADIWEIFISLEKEWDSKESIINNLMMILKTNIVSICVIIVVLTFMIISSISINRFIKYRKGAEKKRRLK